LVKTIFVFLPNQGGIFKSQMFVLPHFCSLDLGDIN
jgi:hypothetical protein